MKLVPDDIKLEAEARKEIDEKLLSDGWPVLHLLEACLFFGSRMNIKDLSERDLYLIDHSGTRFGWMGSHAVSGRGQADKGPCGRPR